MADKDILQYTELAMTLLGGEVPSIIYLPPTLRSRKQRVTTDGMVTLQPYTAEEIQKRVVQADPLGFLIAIMNGQPMPSFRLKKPGKKIGGEGPFNPKKASDLLETFENGTEVWVDYYSPDHKDRERVAQYLLTNFVPNARSRGSDGRGKPKKSDTGDASDPYDAIIARRAAQATK